MLSDKQRNLLLDIAYAGCHKGLVSEARAVCAGVLAAWPGFAPALIGLALSHVVIGERAVAERILKEDVLAKNPEDADARAVLGLTALLDGRPDEAEVLFKPLAAGETSASGLARELLARLN